MSDPWIKTHDEVMAAFRDGAVSRATEQQLDIWLQNLATGTVPNKDIQHAEIIRALAINHVQMARLIRGVDGTMRELNAANTRTQQAVQRLTLVGIGLAFLQVLLALLPFLKH